MVTKFQNEHDEYLYEGSVVSGVMQGEGDVEAPTGWFCPVTLLDADSTQPEDEEERAAVAFYGTRWVVLHEDSDGFVTVIKHETEKRRDRHVKDLQNAFALYEAGITREQALEVVAGYRAAALWSSVGPDNEPLDVSPYSLSAEATQQFSDEAIEFVTSNAEHVLAFVEVTGLGWGQIGHDFWLTRNGHGAGFWDRGVAGPAVDALVESSHAWGEQNLYVSDGEEIEVE